MKITKRHLRKIIRETAFGWHGEGGIDGVPGLDYDKDDMEYSQDGIPAAPSPTKKGSSRLRYADAVEWAISGGLSWEEAIEPLLSAGWPEDELSRVEAEFDMQSDPIGQDEEANMYNYQDDPGSTSYITKEGKIRITASQLKLIIKEEIEKLEYDLSKGLTKIAIDNDYPSEIEAQEDSWAGGQNIHHQINHAKVSGGEENSRGVEMIKHMLEKRKRRMRIEKILGS